MSQPSENTVVTNVLQKMTSTDFGSFVSQSTSGNILGNLSSAHIRQFVSPFYRQFDIYPTDCSDCLKGTQTSKLLLTKTANKKIQSIRRHFNKTKSRKSSAEDSSVVEKRHKIEDIIARVRAPTQSYLLKLLKDKEDETGNDSKKSAIEYAKRVFQCELCKRRNE